jgi:putative hydroxymethylpyrimidine transport system substrate-binding protein
MKNFLFNCVISSEARQSLAKRSLRFSRFAAFGRDDTFFRVLRPHTIAALILFCLLAAPAQAADKLTVMLDWFVNPNHAALVYAREQGFFKEEGLDVTLQQPGDPNDPPKLAAAGSVDLAVSYQPQLHLQVAEGLPLRRVGVLVEQPLNTVMVLADSGITDLKQLKGKKIGFSVGGVEDALLETMLSGAGLSLKDVTLVNVNFSLSAALLAGQVDAVIGAYRNFEAHQLELKGKAGRYFAVEGYGVPLYDELIFVTNTKNVADARLPRFFRALNKATAALKQDNTAARAVFFAAYPETKDELNARAWADTVPLLASDTAALDTARYEAFSAFMRQRGLVKSEQPVSALAVKVPLR